MTFSIQIHLLLFITIFLLLLFPLLNASDSKPCYTSSCRQGNYINIRFPFWLLHKQPESCGHTKFKLLCNDHQETTLNLPTSKPFLVQEIDYQLQRIRLKDPENCLARRLLSFNSSSSWSPFKPLQLLDYTFFTCPNNKTIINSSLHKPIHCLGNSTSSFFATPLHLVSSVPSSCEVLKKVLLPVSDPIGFGGDLNRKSLWLKWDSPDCSLCETKTNSRCGFVNNTNNFQVQCFSSVNNGLHNTSLQVLKIICLSLVGPLMAFTFCVGLVMCSSERVSSLIQNAVVARLSGSVTPQSNEEVIVITTTGLDESTIESYKKVELGESKRLPTGSNDTLCSICLSEYESKETIRCLPECDHCFHSECIDAWLKMHSSCPVCRNNPSPSRA